MTFFIKHAALGVVMALVLGVSCAREAMTDSCGANAGCAHGRHASGD